MKKTYFLKIFLIISFLILMPFLKGCYRIEGQVPDNRANGDVANNEDSVIEVINPERQQYETEIMLYFKHEYADYLVPSKHIVKAGKQSLEELIVEELLKGPAIFDRVCVIPPNVKKLDVIRKGDTVYVNLNNAFKGNIDVRTLPGKQELSEDRVPLVSAEMKNLAIYSIVNSLTELSGVQQVKILINHRAVTFADVGMSHIVANIAEMTPDTALMPLARNSRVILKPITAVNEVFTALENRKSWERAFSFIAFAELNNNRVLTIEEFIEMHTSYISDIVFELTNEEIKHDGTAFVTANLSIAYANGERREKINHNLRVINKEGIWKLIFPEFLLQSAD